jgi:hypothetical protein
MDQSRISLPAPVRPGLARAAWSVVLVVALIAAAGALSSLGADEPHAQAAAGHDALLAAQALAGEFFVLGAALP